MIKRYFGKKLVLIVDNIGFLNKLSILIFKQNYQK